MKAQDYITSLLPNFERSRIQTDLDNIREAITETLIPKYTAADGVFGSHSFTSDFCIHFDKMHKKNVSNHRGNYIKSILVMLESSTSLLDKVDSLVNATFSNDVVANGITYKKAQLLQHVEVLGFAVRYARRLLSLTYTLETPDMVQNASAKSSIKFITSHMDPFMVACNILGTKTSKIEKDLAAIPDMIIAATNANMAEQAHQGKLDPAKMGLIPVSLNPVYHVRMALTKYRINVHKENVEEARLLDIKLLNLKSKREGKADLGLEKQVAYYEDRVAKLRYKIKEMEDGE